jgi:hypothetical protein
MFSRISMAEETLRVEGQVFCDTNLNFEIDALDVPLEGIQVKITAPSGNSVTETTGIPYADYFHITLPGEIGVYTVEIVSPTGQLIIIGNSFTTTTAGESQAGYNILLDGRFCSDEVGACWLTGGGAKFDSTAGIPVAQHGPRDSFGGNVFPSCDPAPGDGGQWNHVAHSAKLHFLGTTIIDVECGNVPGTDPGSESPVTPFNFIEFSGSGTLSGIHGNKLPKTNVYFFARCEDRNEPGSNGQSVGTDIDRYFLNVFSDINDPVGSSLLCLDVDGNPATVDPVTITGGNLQLHISSCDDPPL